MMASSIADLQDIVLLRQALGRLDPGSAHQANIPPKPENIFTPYSHANALDPQRALVVGNRGVGKSFWSSVLTHSEARDKVAPTYPRLSLSQIRAALGFHEAAGKDDGAAPSPALLVSLNQSGYAADEIWRGVLVKAVAAELSFVVPGSLSSLLLWSRENVEESEALLRAADAHFVKNNQVFLLVFDALDRLGRDWNSIRSLTQGVLRLALDMRGFRAMKAKIFMRSDQSKDDSLFAFADASKIRSDAVSLVWRHRELFGWLYSYLSRDREAGASFVRLVGGGDLTKLRPTMLTDSEVQQEIFYRLAGEFMGAGPKRGRTYTWLYDHLSDTFGETSPRSFITAMQRAADFQPAPRDHAVDHLGIRAGVQAASRVRVQQLKEDYDWIDKVMAALRGLEVPCDPEVFLARWRERGTVADLRSEADGEARRLPIELTTAPSRDEGGLLAALQAIGVIEFRTPYRINMPDIFRVDAGIKRRGGIRPPSARREQS